MVVYCWLLNLGFRKALTLLEVHFCKINILIIGFYCGALQL